MKNDPVTTLLTLLRDPAAGVEAHVAAAGWILEAVLAGELEELKRRVVALEVRRQQKKQRRSQ